MSFKKALALVLAILIICMPLNYSFAQVFVEFNVTRDGGTGTVTSAVYCDNEKDASGITVSFAVYDGIDQNGYLVDKTTGTTPDDVVNGFYRYILETFTFPINADNYQFRLNYFGPPQLPQPETQLTGTVYLPGDKTKYAGTGRVELYKVTNDYFTCVPINEDGTYRIAGLSAGSYKVYARPDDIQYCESLTSDFVIAEDGKNYGLTDLPLTLIAAQFSGSIFDANQQAVLGGGNHVEIRTVEGALIHEVMDNSNGQFAYYGLQPGNYSIMVFTGPDSKYMHSDEVPFQIGLDNKLANGPLTIILNERPPAQFSGTVYLPDGKTAYTSGGRVEVRTEYDYITDSQIKQDGTYSVGGLENGTYYLVAIPDMTVDYFKSSKTPIIIENGVLKSPSAPVNLSLTLPQFSGTVVMPNGTDSFTEGWIDLMTQEKCFDNVKIQQNGVFVVGGLTEGTYRIQARPYDDAGAVCKSNEVDITITGDKLTSPLGAIKLTMSTPQFTGYVKDPMNNPVEFTNVDIKDINGKYIDSLFVGKGGIFKVAGLTNGYYKMCAHAPKDSEYAASVEVEIQISGDKLVGNSPVLTLRKPQITGTIVDPKGAPVSYSNVEIKGIDVNYGTGEGTGENGVFKIAGLLDGKYSIRGTSWNTGFSPSAAVEITISGGKYTPPLGGLVLKLTQPQASGTVYLSDGITPEKYSWIEINDKDGKYIAGAQTNDKGVFNIGGLANGDYYLKAHPNWENQEYTVSNAFKITISGGTCSVVEISLILCEPQISGSVKEPLPSGKDVYCGYLEVKNDAGEWLPGVSIQNGKFALGSLIDDIYTIRAIPDSNSQYSASNQFTFKILGGDLDASYADGDYTGDSIVLTLQSAQITGTVIDPKGQPLKGGWVEVRSPDEKSGKYYGGANIGYDGKFRIAGLEDASYVLIAWPNSGTTFTSSKEVLVTISGGSYKAPEGGLKLTVGVPQIIGEVVAPDGTPEGNGFVEVMTADGYHVKGSGVDNMADFTIGGLKDGTYYLKAYPGDGSKYSASIETVVKIANGVYSGGTLVLKLTSAQLTGHVYEPNNTPVDNGWVCINKTTGEYVGGAQIQNGMFKIGSLKPGNYKVIAYPKDKSSYSESDAVGFTINTSGLYTGSEINLKLRSPQITGFVKGPIDGLESGNVMPYGFIEIKSGEKYICGTGVDYDGKFKISGLAQGTYKLIAMPGGETKYSPSAEVTVEIDSNGQFKGTSPLTINLTEAQINGTVKDPNNNISKFGYCEVNSAETGEWIAGTPVNQNGNFAIGNLKSGTYTLRVHPEYSESSNYSASKPITVVIGENGKCTYANNIVYAGNVDVKLTSIQLKGTVIKPDSNPLVKGWVEIQKDSGSNNWIWVGGTGLNSEGQFNIGGLSNGTYRMKAYPETLDSSYSPSAYIVFVVENEVVTKVGDSNYSGSVTVSLTQAQISGTITGPNSETIEYGWVEITNQAGAFVTGIGAKEDGSFSIGGLSDGTYKIKAYPGWKSSYTPSLSRTITISGQSYSGGALTLTLQNVQITGTVVDPGDIAVDWGWVELYNSNGQWVASTGVDENGKFRMSGLANGSYKIQAFPENGSDYAPSEKVDIVIAGGIMTSPASLKLQLEEPTMTGIVHRPDNTLAKGGWIEIGDETENWLVTIPINKDGTFKLPDLKPGTYTIQAFPKEGSPYAKSDVMTFTVDSDGNYTDEGSASIQAFDLQFNYPE